MGAVLVRLAGEEHGSSRGPHYALLGGQAIITGGQGGKGVRVGFWEIVIILLVALVLFGPSRLPEMGRALGKAIREFRRATADLGEELEKARAEISSDGAPAAATPPQPPATAPPPPTTAPPPPAAGTPPAAEAPPAPAERKPGPLSAQDADRT
jgi:sec-independent protein translocase protein TatA